MFAHYARLSIPCRWPSCLAQPGNPCRSTGGYNTATHKVRVADWAALTPEQQDEAVAAMRAARTAAYAALDLKPLTAAQLATRARISEAWSTICRETR